MGGTLPYLKWRLDHTFTLSKTIPLPINEKVKARWESVTKAPSEYMKQYYFDTALSTDEGVYKLACDISPDNILFGSDAFFASRKSMRDFKSSLESFLSESELESVYRTNALKLFEKNK